MKLFLKPPAAGSVSDLQDHLGFWLRVVSNSVHASFERSIGAEGVTVAQWVALRILYGRPGLALGELAEAAGVDQGAVSRLVDRLAAKGLVQRLPRKDDRRAVTLRLTNAGKGLVPRLARLADENDASFFAKLDGKDRAELLHTLKEIVAANGLPVTANK